MKDYDLDKQETLKEFVKFSNELDASEWKKMVGKQPQFSIIGNIVSFFSVKKSKEQKHKELMQQLTKR